MAFGFKSAALAAEIAGTSYTIETNLPDTVDVITENTTTQGDWIKPEGTPSTISQGSSGGADPYSKGHK